MAFAQKATDHESVSIYPYDNEQLEKICNLSGECVLNWSTKDGWPVGVMHAYVWHEGRFWITCGGHRHRVAALRRDPRCSVVISGRTAPPDSGCPTGTATAKGRAIIHENDQELKDWFYPALGKRLHPDSEEDAANFVEMLDSPLRVVLEIIPEKWITFDSAKSARHHAGTIDESELGPELSSDATRMSNYRSERYGS
tara:strand:- start:322 stop:915 length:594 start_codon:yes stop_codon:yes gene_type:complete